MTGQVAGPVARALAADNEVWGAARFRDPVQRDTVEAAGIRPVTLPHLEPTAATIESVNVDTTRMHELIGPARVGWRAGLRRMAEARHPRLFMD